MGDTKTTGGWIATARDALLRWPATFQATLAAPKRLAPPREGLNPPGLQLVPPFLATVLLQAATGLDSNIFDRTFEFPPALGWFQAVYRLIPGMGLALTVLLCLVYAIPAWLLWRLVDRRARLGAVVQAQLYVLAMMLPLMLATMALKAGAAAAGAGANNDLVNMVFPALAMGMALWGTALLAWLAPRLAEASIWRFAGALVISLAAMALLSLASPLPWPPRWEYAAQSASMEPTVVAGDQIAVNLWAFGWREPRRGELVVYKVRGVPRLGRVIGLPGETVALRDGQVTIDGKPLARRPFGPPGPVPNGGWPVQGQRFVETAADGHPHLTQSLDDFGMAATWGPQRVPAGRYFILGDNRDNAADSRFEPPEGPGFVPRADLVGPIYRRSFPLGRPLDALQVPPAAPGRR